jgi:hypothetical protein
MEEVKNNQGSGLAIGALITGIVALLIAVIPCIGIVAAVPGVVAVVLGIIGLSRGSDSRGMLIGGLIVGLLAVMLSFGQMHFGAKIFSRSDSWSKDIENAVNDIKTEIGDDFDGKEFSIKVTNNKDTIEVKTTTSGHDLEKTLDELEGDTITTVIIKK